MDSKRSWLTLTIWPAWVDVLLVLIILGIFLSIFVPQCSARRNAENDAEVKTNIKNAATAQEAYFMDYGTYTSNIGSLTGFNQGSNVTITVEATETIYLITGTRKKGCKANTGTWFIESTTGTVDGTRCRWRWP